MTEELKLIQYHDVLTELVSAIEEYGVRRVLTDLEYNYPGHFQQIHDLLTKQDSDKKVCALCKKDANTM